MFSHKKLSETNTTLKTYSGQTIKPAGIVNVKVTYGGQENHLDLFVVKNDSPALFCRSWLKYIKLDWNSVKLFNTSKSTEEHRQEILQKYNSVFIEGAGKVKSIRATLTLKDNAQPKF